MKHSFKTLPVVAAATLSLTLVPVVALAATPYSYYIDSYGHPYTALSSYNTHPGDMITATAHGYEPGEYVVFRLAQQRIAVHANDQGMASTSLTVPWQQAGNQMVTASADAPANYSQAGFYINGYYPQTNPSSYYVAKGQMTSVSGTGFAPNEQVKLMVKGSTVATMNADGGGNVSFSYTTPSSGSTYDVALMGMRSQMTSTRTITLAQ